MKGRDHVLIDGAPAAGSVLTLSHWPATPTPVPLRADTSAESALRWRARPGRWPGAALASIDHLDQDGLVGLFAVVAPGAARATARRLVEVARAGDFAAFSDRQAARASFALAALADPARSPLPGATLSDPGALTAELLGRLAELVEHPGRELWAEEDAALAATESDLARGLIGLEEVPGLDLAVVRLEPALPTRLATRFMAPAERPCHPAAIHNATTCGRVLYCHGGRYLLVARYESWVRLASRRPAPRVDLAALASALQASEPPQNVARWSADPAPSLVQCLSSGGPSELSTARVRSLVEAHLAAAPPAWLPWAEASPLVGQAGAPPWPVSLGGRGHGT